jgi:hypothetical protein
MNIRILLLAALFAALALNAPPAYAEVLSREIGPRSQLDTNNTNRFNPGQGQQEAHAGCDAAAFQSQYGAPPCPRDMTWVCSRHFGISVCVDTELKKDGSGLPRGNFSRTTCAAACEAEGKRLPRNNEWLVACTGTPIAPCLNYRGEWPPGHFARIQGHPCSTYGTGSGRCMSDPALTRLMPPVAEACVSEAGVSGCVGTLGQWVHEIGTNSSGNRRGRFNGGLFPQPASSVIYTTTAHGPDYSDYSIGCRCARDPGR